MISVIVPVYNTEKYLDQCVQSILSQTYTDFELLLIDDGSTDSSGVICDKYAEQDERVRVFHQQNSGVTQARKRGVEKSRGQYICFIDADDWVLATYLATFVAHINDRTEVLVATTEEKLVKISDHIKSLLLNVIEWGMPFKLYSRSCICEDANFAVPRAINIGEDLIANLSIVKTVNSIHYIVNNGYIVRENEESVTRSRSWSLEYATLFVNYIKRTLGQSVEEYYPALWLLILRSVKNLISNGVMVSRSSVLYKEILNNKPSPLPPIGLGDIIILNVSNPGIARLCLRIIEKIKR